MAVVASDEEANGVLDPEECSQAIRELCLQYEQLKVKPTLHDVMRDVEELDSVLSRDHDVASQCRWLTCIANNPCMFPDSPLNAEVQVNALLQYLSSPRPWVRALTCSLLRVFSSALNASGEHIATQVTIICKNLATTLNEAIKMKDLSLCQAVACSSLCAVCVFWVKTVDPAISVQFLILTLQNIIHILQRCKEHNIPQFTTQVAVDGLRCLVTTPGVWDGILTPHEQKETLVQIFDVLESFVSAEMWNDTIVAKLFEAVNDVNILRTALECPDQLHKLLVILMDIMAQLLSTESPVLVVRWRALALLCQIVHLISPAQVELLGPVIRGGCCEPGQASLLCNIVTSSYSSFLALQGNTTAQLHHFPSFPADKHAVVCTQLGKINSALDIG